MDTGWAEVYACHYDRLVALVTVIAGSRAEAEEAVQEAFVRALGLTGRRVVMADHEAWLYRVAVNVVRSRWRRVLAGRRAAAHLAVETAAPAAVPADTRLTLLAAIRTLPFAQREAIALHYFADLPIAEIAVRLGCPQGTVKARLSRGREALARRLADDSMTGGERDA